MKNQCFDNNDVVFLQNFLPKIKFEPYISFINITLKYSNPNIEENSEPQIETKNNNLDDKKGKNCCVYLKNFHSLI